MKTAGRVLLRFFADWKNGATALASIVIALLIVLTVEGVRSRNQAAEALREQADQATQLRSAASRRIDTLNKRIETLETRSATGEAQRGRLSAAVEALAEQIRQMGGDPVVISRSDDSVASTPTTTTPPSGPRATASPRPTASPSPRPSRPAARPTPGPSPTCRVTAPVVGCVR